MRTKYLWDENLKQLIEIDSDWTDTPRRAQTVTEELVYGNLRASDGTDISSRRKHRNYMKDRGLALAGDYKETWAKAAEERSKILSGEKRDPNLRHELRKSWYKHTGY